MVTIDLEDIDLDSVTVLLNTSAKKREKAVYL